MIILIVDDSTVTRKMILKTIPLNIRESATIFEGTNGEEAVNLCKKHSPDVVFLDLTMPVMNGYHALPIILENDPTTVVYIVTADIQKKAKEKVLADGAAGVVGKPMTQKRMEEIFSGLKRAAPVIEDELKEALSELINISFGSATAAIADLFDSFATLHIPEIKIKDSNEIQAMLMEGLDRKERFITTQQFKGEFYGETVFIIDHQSAQNVQRIIDGEDGREPDEYNDEIETLQYVLELSNILSSSCAGKLAELLGSEVSFNPPVVNTVDDLVAGSAKKQYSHIVVVKTVLEFEDSKIYGELCILFSDQSFAWLKQALYAFLKAI